MNEKEQRQKEKNVRASARELPESTEATDTWKKLREIDLKISLLSAAQEQALRRNSVKHHIDKSAE